MLQVWYNHTDTFIANLQMSVLITATFGQYLT